MILNLRELARPGLYVVEFPGRSKIGRSVNLLGRLGQHGELGGLRAWLSTPLTPFGAIDCEKRALLLARELVERPDEHPLSESFKIAFEECVELVRGVVEAYEEPEPVAVPLPDKPTLSREEVATALGLRLVDVVQLVRGDLLTEYWTAKTGEPTQVWYRIEDVRALVVPNGGAK